MEEGKFGELSGGERTLSLDDRVALAQNLLQRNKPDRAIKRYIEAFYSGCDQCDALLAVNNTQQAIAIWIKARDAYTEMRKIMGELNQPLNENDFNRFQTMAERMRPYTQAEPNS